MTAIATDRRLDHLARANEVRCGRARLGARIAAGEATVAAVLLAPPPETLTWTVGGLLMAQHRWGATRMHKLLSRTGSEDAPPISELKRVGALTDRQRRLLAGLAAR